MKSEKGQSLVEFALVLPVLLLLLFGITDFGRIFYAYLTIDHAGREAARATSVGQVEDLVNNCDGQSVEASDDLNMLVKKAVVCKSTGVSLSTSDVTVTGALDVSGESVTIDITYPINFLTPVISSVVGSFNISNSTVMRIE